MNSDGQRREIGTGTTRSFTLMGAETAKEGRERGMNGAATENQLTRVPSLLRRESRATYLRRKTGFSERKWVGRELGYLILKPIN
ncbi:unnamed protein product [Linum trigynum]|uniref:Uncharacterized protein n=1 Tax=Linum trigynum TaxID=586398 RepID=A0AAV2C998_9ROSI